MSKPADTVVRRARPADAAAFARLMGHPEVYPSLMQLPLASEETWRTRIEEFAGPGRTDIQIVAELEGQVVASAGLHPFVPLRRRHCAMLGISVLPDAQRRGIGTALMQTLCDFADDWAQIFRIELTVFSDNQGAQALYRRFDFRHEGTHRAYAMRDGAYADALSMARLHPKPPRLAWADG